MRREPRQDDRRQAGLTLIELTVVLVLMALLTATVVLGSQGMIGGATRDSILSEIQSIDQAARRHAEQTGHAVRLTLDPSSGRITVTTPDRPGSPPLRDYQLPRGYVFDDAWRLRRGGHREARELVLIYDAQGRTSSWGVSLKAGSQSGDDQSMTQALLVLGATGQTTIWENDEAAKDILAQISRHDAD